MTGTDSAYPVVEGMKAQGGWNEDRDGLYGPEWTSPS